MARTRDGLILRTLQRGAPLNMQTDSIDRVAEQFELAQRHFDQGRLIATVELLEPISRGVLPCTLAASVDHLHCLAAFRLGQLGECLARARSFLQHVDPGVESTLEQRFAVLAVAVVAAGESARYEECLEHLAELLGLASRLGGLSHYVRARGTAASAFLLMGDPWAAQRILSVLTCEFDRPHSEQRLETTMRCNHASLCLLLARMARDAGDDEAEQSALQDAEASVSRAMRQAVGLKDLRIVTYVQLHRAELSLRRGEIKKARVQLDGAAKDAEAAGLNAHWRHLQLLRAELLLAQGDPQQALDVLEALRQAEDANNEFSTRIRQRELEYLALVGLGRAADALQARQAYDKLLAYRSFRQARAQSTLMRTRLELEHLFQRSSERKAFANESSGGGAAGAPAKAKAAVSTKVPTRAPRRSARFAPTGSGPRP